MILCYHGISQRDEHEWHPEYYMPPAAFERRLELLSRGNYNVLPLNEAVRRLAEGTLPPRAVAITFDDGCVDFYRVACPALRKYGYPATVYLTTYYSDFNRPVFGFACRYMLWKQRATSPGASPEIGWNEPPVLSTSEGRRRAWQAIEAFATVRNLTGAEKDELAERLAHRIGFDYNDLLSSRLLHLMLPSEVAEVQRWGMSVELHTHRHRTPDDEQLFKHEIVRNRDRIVAITGLTPSHFCYPSGVYTPSLVRWLRDLGVVSGTTCEAGLAGRDHDSLLLPRFVDTVLQSDLQVESWLSGFADFLPRRGSRPAQQAVSIGASVPARSHSAGA